MEKRSFRDHFLRAVIEIGDLDLMDRLSACERLLPSPSQAATPEELAHLALFRELPDTDEELAVQHHNDLTTFTCFPNLPVEIRLKIFRHTFPEGRFVNISIPPQTTPTPRWYTDNFARMNKCPVALMINRESRYEALGHYVVEIKPRSTLLCFNPFRDKAQWRKYKDMTAQDTPNWLLRKVCNLRAYTRTMGRVIVVGQTRWIWKDHETKVKAALAAEVFPEDFFLTYTTSFPRLKTVRLRAPKPEEATLERHRKVEGARRKEMLDLLGKCLERLSSAWDGRVPNIEYD